MNILDAVIIIFFILGIMSGFRRGFIKQTVLLIGIVAILVFSFYLRIPISTFLYKNLPFFKFYGIFKGVSILNILLYEIIAFLIVFSILYLILRLILKITGWIEKLLKATVILGFFSKIAGGIVGLLEAYILVFVLLFLFSQPFMKITGIDDSFMAKAILDHTPVMSGAVENTRIVINELGNLATNFKKDNKKFNEEAIRLFIKYEIISEENVEYLRNKGKLD